MIPPRILGQHPATQGTLTGAASGADLPTLQDVLAPVPRELRGGVRRALIARTPQSLDAYRTAVAGLEPLARAAAVARASAFLRTAGALSKALDDGGRYEVTGPLGEALWAAQSAQLAKGAGHKYIKRVKGPNGKWRYFYTVARGGRLGAHEDLHVGAKFAIADGGQHGHFEITASDGGHVTIRHDETGRTQRIEKHAFSAMLRQHHATAIDAHRARLERDAVAAARHGTLKQSARIAAEAARHGHLDLTGDELAQRRAAAEASAAKRRGTGAADKPEGRVLGFKRPEPEPEPEPKPDIGNALEARARQFFQRLGEKQAAERTPGHVGRRIHYTGDMANLARNGEVISIAGDGQSYRVRWDDGTESGVSSYSVNPWGQPGARFAWEDEDPSGAPSAERVVEMKRQAVAHRAERDAEAAAEKKAHEAATAGWHKPADRGEAIKRIKAALQALHPDTKWSVRGSTGTAYGWIHTEGDDPAAAANVRELVGLHGSVSPDSRERILRDLERHAGIFTPGVGHKPGSAAAKHKAAADASAAAKAAHGDAKFHVGQVVTLHGSGRRYVVTGYEDFGHGRRYSARALSGSVKGSGPTSIDPSVMAPHPDQVIAFTGAEAAQRRAHAIRELAGKSGSPHVAAAELQEAHAAALAGRAVVPPAATQAPAPTATATPPRDVDIPVFNESHTLSTGHPGVQQKMERSGLTAEDISARGLSAVVSGRTAADAVKPGDALEVYHGGELVQVAKRVDAGSWQVTDVKRNKTAVVEHDGLRRSMNRVSADVWHAPGVAPKRATPDQITGDELTQRREAARRSADARRKAPEPEPAPVATAEQAPAPQGRPAGFVEPVTFTGQVVESATKKRGTTVWSVPNTGTIPGPQFAAMKADAEGVKGYYLRGQGFTFRDPKHAEAFTAKWGSGGQAGTATPDAAPQVDRLAQRRAEAQASAARAGDVDGQAEDADDDEDVSAGWRATRAARSGLDGARADVQITPLEDGSHKHRLVINGKDHGEAYIGDAQRRAVDVLGRGQALRNAERNAAVARAAVQYLGLDPGGAPPPVPDKLQPTRIENADAMAARHAAELETIASSGGGWFERTNAEKEAKVRHEIEAFEAGHRWQTPGEVRSGLDRAQQRGIVSWGRKRTMGLKNPHLKHLLEALPKIAARHREHEKAKEAHTRATGSAASRLGQLYRHLATTGQWRTGAPEVGEIVTHKNGTGEVARAGSRNARVAIPGAPDKSGALRGHHELGMPHAEAIAAVMGTASDADLAEVAGANAVTGGLRDARGGYSFGVRDAAAEIDRRKKAGTWTNPGGAVGRTVAEINADLEAHDNERKAKRAEGQRLNAAREAHAAAELAKRAEAPAPKVSRVKRTDEQKKAAALAEFDDRSTVDSHAGNVTVVRTEGRYSRGPSWSLIEHHDDGSTLHHAGAGIERQRDARAYAEDLREVHKRAGAATTEHLQAAAELEHLAGHLTDASVEVPDHLKRQGETSSHGDGVVRMDAWDPTHRRGSDAARAEDAQRMLEIAGRLRSGHSHVDASYRRLTGAGPGRLAGIDGGYVEARKRYASTPVLAGAAKALAPAALDRDSLLADARRLTAKTRALMSGKDHSVDDHDDARKAPSSARSTAWGNGYTFRAGKWQDGDEGALYGHDGHARHRLDAAVEALKAAGVRPVPHGHFPTRDSGGNWKTIPAPGEEIKKSLDAWPDRLAPPCAPRDLLSARRDHALRMAYGRRVQASR